MMKRLFAIALLAAIPSFLATPAAKADNLSLNQWYSGAFGTDVPSPVSGPPYATATDGPVLGDGFANSIAAPSTTTFTITLTGPGTLTVTDLEASGDQYIVLDNGSVMALAPNPFTGAGQNPGQVGYISGGSSYTSVPVVVDNVGEDINAALGDSNFSSGTFALDAGVNNITIDYDGVVGNGDVAFIAESTPEPSSLILFGSGLAGFLVTLRRKIKA